MTKLSKPMTFDAANRWLAARVNVPTGMSSAELALSKNFRATVKAHAFFSAKVAEARVLERIRSVSDAYSGGLLGLAEARSELKRFLGGADDVANAATPPPGVSEDAWKAAKSVQNISSTARLDLILKQNAAMAHAVGQREVSMHPDIVARWPYFRYYAVGDSHVRETHAQLDGLTLPKDDPFWHTHTPPWDYACRCWIEDFSKSSKDRAVTKETPDGTQTARVEVAGRSLIVDAPPSGYVFDVRSAFETQDMSRVKNISIRRATLKSIAAFVRKNDDVRFNLVPGPAVSLVPPVAGNSAKTAEYIAGQTAELAESGAFADTEIGVGSLSHEVLDGLGIKSGKVLLGKGSATVGLEHMMKHHSGEVRDGGFARAIADTLFSARVKTSLQFKNKITYLNIYNPETDALTVARKVGEGETYQVVSAHYPKKETADKLGGLNYESE